MVFKLHLACLYAFVLALFVHVKFLDPRNVYFTYSVFKVYVRESGRNNLLCCKCRGLNDESSFSYINI